MIEAVGGQALRQRVYENISQEAWELWKGRLTMLMNEHRLNMMDQALTSSSASRWKRFSLGKAQPCHQATYRPGRHPESRREGSDDACCAHFYL